VSHLFERPLCEFGRAYDFALRPAIGDPDLGTGGPCDDRPHRVELYGALADVRAPDAEWRPFEVCPDHESQLRAHDRHLTEKGAPSRFRSPRPG